MSFSVGEVARLARVTVRTLHHYDEIGLLSPGERTAAGYRRYGEADLQRLEQILYYRELGFTLGEVASVVDDPDADRSAHLQRQHALLVDQVDRLQAMIAAVEKALEAQQMGINLTPQERFEVFGELDPEEHAAEAEERWGGTDAYKESQRRAASYSKDDWKRIMAEAGETTTALAEAMRSGDPATSAVAMDLVEEHRQHIRRWFYDCTFEIHRGLADMYVADPRFTATYDATAPGLAQYISDAIHANADRAAA